MINRRTLLMLAACVFPVTAGEMPEKAERYREMLLKRPENAVVFGRMLDAWLEEREFEALAPELESRAEEGSAEDWRVLAMLHQHAGDEEATVAALDEAVKRAPEDAPTRLARAKALGAMLRFDAALEDVELALADAGLGVEAGSLKGKLLLRAGRPAEAVEAWQELIARHPADEGLKEDLISLQIGEGMFDEAVAAARGLAEATDDPYKKALRQLQVAEILAQAGRKDEARAEYRVVFDVSAENSWLEREVLARVVDLFSRDDDPAGLQGFLGDLRDAYPRRVAVKKEAAKSLLATGSEDEAVAMFREVLKVLPGDREVREEFIALLEAAGRTADAAEETEALLAVAPDDAALWERLAFLKDGLDDAAGVDAALDRALALLADDESGAVSAARLLERFERVDEAEKRLREAVATHGAEGEAGETLAAFLVAHGKPDEALEIWRGMTAEADREGLLRIARALSAHGQAQEAFGMLEPRVAEFPDDPLLLTALCQAAQLGEEPEAAIPHAMSLVRLAKSTTDLDSALRLAVALVSRAEDPRKWIESLADHDGEASVQEICLSAELHESLLGDSLRADKLLEAAMADDPDRLAANQRVRLHELRGEFSAAAEAMRELIALPGGAKTAHEKRLVELLERSGDFQGALDRTGEWLKLAPGDKQVWLKRAELFLAEGRPLEAVAELRRAVAKFGGEEDLRARLAEAQREAGMMEEAWRTFVALHDEAESPSAKLKWVGDLATLARQEGREEELEADFERRSRDNPTSPLPLLAMAEMHRAWQDPDEETRCVAEAARRKPEDASLKFRLADLHETAGDTEAAAGILRGMLGGADAAEARRRLAAFWIRQGETERGLRELAAAGAGADARTLEKLVMQLAGAKEWEAALSILERERPAYPEDWRLAHLHAVALLEAGREDEAFDLFVSQLEAEGDVAGTVPPTQLAGWRPPGVRKQVRRDAIPLFPQYARTLTAHRGDNHYGGRTGEVVLPGDADDARRLALAGALHLIGPEVDERLRPGRLSRIASSHFDDLDGLKRMVSLETPEARRDALLAEDATPGMFKWFMHQAGQLGDSVDREILERGLRLGVEKDPELAFLMAYGFRNQPEGIGADEARAVMDLVDEVEGDAFDSGIHFLIEIAFVHHHLPEDLRRQAEARYLRYLEESDEGLTKANIRAASVAVEYARHGRLEEAVEWINRLQDPPPDGPARPRGVRGRFHPAMMSGYPGGTMLGALDAHSILRFTLPYPYMDFVAGGSGGGGGITEAQRKLLQILGESGQLPHQQKHIDAEAFADAAAGIEDPLVRIGIYLRARRDEEVEREISAIESAEDEVPAAALLLAATHRAARSAGDGKAYALLLRARQAADAKPLHEVIDAQLIRIGAEVAAAGDDEADLEPAKRAALRARRQFAYDHRLKIQLGEAMTKLGLEEEAKRYVAGPGPVRASPAGSRGSARPAAPLQDLAGLVRAGKRDAAARRLVSDLRVMQADPQRRHQPDQLIAMVTSLQLEDDVVAASEPAPGASFLRRKFHALLLVNLKRSEEALPWLEALAAEKADDSEVNGALLAALPPEKRRERLKELAAGDFDTGNFGDLIAGTMSRHTAEALDGGRQMKEVLEVLEPSFEAARNLSWVNYHAKQLAEMHWMDTKPLRPIFGKIPDREYEEEFSGQRETICRELFREMVRHPQTAEQGFILLSAAAGSLGISEEELDAAAVRALRGSLLVENDGKRSNWGNRSYALWAWYRGTGSNSSGGSPAGGVEPAVYLARRKNDGLRVSLLDDEAFRRELRESHEAQAEVLDRCRDMVLAEGTEAFERWRAEVMKQPEKAARELPVIGQLIEETGRDDLRPLVRQVACEQLRSDRGPHSAQLASVAVQEVLEAPDPEAGAVVIKALALELLGPEEAWPLYGQLGNTYHHPVYQRMQAWSAAVAAMSGDLRAVVALMRFSGRSGVPDNIMGPSPRNTFQMLANVPPPVGELLAAGAFSFGPEMLRGDSQGTLMDGVLGILNAHSEKKEVAAELAKVEGDDRFWARIAGATLVENPEAVKAELDGRAKAIAAWPAEDQARLARFVERSFPAVVARLGPAMRKVFEQGLAQGTEEVRREALAYLDDGFPQDFTPHNATRSISPLAARLLESDPELTAKLWMAVLETLARQHVGWGTSNGGFPVSVETWAHGQMMEGLLQAKCGFPALAQLHHELESVPEPAVLPGFSHGNFDYYLQSRLGEDVASRGGAAKEDTAAKDLPEAARPLAASLVAMTRETGETARPALAGLLGLAIHRSSNFPLTAIRESGWIDKKLALEDARVARGARIAVMAKDFDKLGDEEKSKLADDCAAFLADSDVPLSLRIMMLVKIRDLAPLGAHEACAEAAAGAWQQFLARPRQWATRDSMATLQTVAGWRAMPPETAKELLVALDASRIDYASHGGRQDIDGPLGSIRMSLAMRSGDDESIRKAVREVTATMRGRLDFSLELWRAGFPEEATRLLARPGDFHSGLAAVFQGKSYGVPYPDFSKEIEAALPGWLATIRDPAQRFRVECLFSSLPDAGGDAAPEVARPERIAALAGRFAEEAPKPRAARMETLAALAAEPAAAASLVEEVSAAVGKTDYSSVLATRRQPHGGEEPEENVTIERLIQTAMRLELEVHGDAGPLLEQVEGLQVLSGSGEFQWHASETINGFIRPMSALLVRRIAELEGEPRAVLAAQALELCTSLLRFPDHRGRAETVALSIASQAAAGDGAALDRWLEALPPELKSRFEQQRGNSNLQQHFSTLRQPELRDERFTAARRALLTAMLSDPATLARDIQHPTDVSVLVDSGLFDLDDACAAIDALPDDHPQRPQFLTEKAGMIGWRTDRADDTIAAYEAAIEAAEATGDPKALAYARSYWAAWLNQRHGKHAEAVEIARSLDFDDLGEKERNWMTDLLKSAE